MAFYDAALADRVRKIKELQQRHRLPLKLIGEVLEPAPSAKVRRSFSQSVREQLGGLTPEVMASQAVMAREKPRKLTKEQVLVDFGVDEADLELLRELELVEPWQDSKGSSVYGALDLELIEVIDETRRQGLGDVFPMEILAPYRDEIRGLVRMELDLFEARVLERESGTDQPAQNIADLAVVLAERLLIALRKRLFLNEAKPKSPSLGTRGRKRKEQDS